MNTDKQRLDSVSVESKKEGCCPPASKLYRGLVITSFVMLVLTIAIKLSYSYLSTLFFNRRNITRRYESSGLNPPSWAFAIWAVIYLWNLIFMAYSVASFFPKYRLHRVPLAVFPVYIVNCICGILWFVFSEQYIRWAGTFAIIGLPVTLYICMGLSIRSLKNHPCRFFLYTYLVNNALAIYAGWTSVAYLLYLAQTLIYSEGTDKIQTGTVLLSWLLVKLTVFCSLEVTVLDRYLRHIWAHYLAFIVAVGGGLLNHFDGSNPKTFLSVAIFGVVGFAFVVKLLRIILGRCDRQDLVESEAVLTDVVSMGSIESPNHK